MATKKRKKKSQNPALKKKAQRLISEPRFLYKAGQKIGEIGVVGEERLRLIVFLAAVTRNLPDKASVLVKGSTSSGKSTVVKHVLQLFPPSCIVDRAGLSKKAIPHGHGNLGDKILLMTEYQSGREAQFFLRLMQSEGQIKHEATTVRGANRRTKTYTRTGIPVVITTTTLDKVFPDDETRFLSSYVSEGPEQTLAILRAQARGKPCIDSKDLELWRAATGLLRTKPGDFGIPPNWLDYVAEHLPLGEVRVRRDWIRFLAFLRAVALCRPRPDRGPLDISSGDYCVAYKIFEPVLVASVRELPAQEMQVAQTIARPNKETGEAATIRDVAKRLGWKEDLVRKRAKSAVKNRLAEFEPGNREKNVKRLVARDDATKKFLPTPRQVLKHHKDIGRKIKYVDPFNGTWKVVRR